MDNKRLCNLGAPQKLNKAVNLDTLERRIRVEIQQVMDIISGLQSDYKNLDLIVEAHRDGIDNKLTQHHAQIQTIKELVSYSSQNIRSTDLKVLTSKKKKNNGV